MATFDLNDGIDGIDFVNLALANPDVLTMPGQDASDPRLTDQQRRALAELEAKRPAPPAAAKKTSAEYASMLEQKMEADPRLLQIVEQSAARVRLRTEEPAFSYDGAYGADPDESDVSFLDLLGED